MNIYVGFDHTIVDNWHEVVPPPKKPSNWKQETYEAKLDELRLKQMDGLPTHLAAGKITKVYIDTGKEQIEMAIVDFMGYLLRISCATVIGLEHTLHELRQCAWTAAAIVPAIPTWVWNSKLKPDMEALSLMTISGAAGDGITRRELMTHFGLAADLIDNAEPIGNNGADVLKAVVGVAKAMSIYS